MMGVICLNSNSKESFIKVFNNFKNDEAETKFKKKNNYKKKELKNLLVLIIF